MNIYVKLFALFCLYMPPLGGPYFLYVPPLPDVNPAHNEAPFRQHYER
jgi:hypothetical protein